MKKKLADNQLLQRAVIKAMPAGALAMMGMSVSYMVDAILAGAFFSPTHIACVAIVLPYAFLAFALTGVLSNGAVLRMTNCIGRGDKEGRDRYFSMLFSLVPLVGLLFIGLTWLFSAQIVSLFGARDGGEEVVALCVVYLRAYSPCILIGAINLALGTTLRAHGLNREALLMMVIQFFANVGFSLLLVLGTDIGFAALGVGSALANLMATIMALSIIRRKKLGLKIRRYRYRQAEITAAAKLGLPSTGDFLSDSISSGIVNNIIVASLGITPLAVYTVAKNTYNMVSWAVGGMGFSILPLYGILFGARDKNGLKRVLKTSTGYGFLYALVWCAIVIACLPVLMLFYGADKSAGVDPDTVRTIVYCMMAFVPLVLLSFQMERIFEATGRFKRSLVISITPDSILFPLFLLLLLKPLGYTGIWMAYGSSYVTFLLVYFVWQSVKNRRVMRSAEDVLDLPQDIRENVPRFDVSIDSAGEAIAGLAHRIQSFLQQENISKRTAYMTALCLEELAADMAAHAGKKSGLLDIKMFVDSGSISVNIRNSAAPYNPLDFDFDREDLSKLGVFMAQKVAERIEYNYVYKMNMVDIAIADAPDQYAGAGSDVAEEGQR